MEFARSATVRTRFAALARQTAIGTRTAVKKFNPVYIYGTLREDIKRLKEAKMANDAQLRGQLDLIKGSVRIKLAAAIAISEFIGTYVGAPLTGTAVQYLTGSAYKGVIGTIVGDYFPAVASAGIAWYSLNNSYYAASAPSRIGRIRIFFRDMLPIYGTALLAAIPTYLIGGTLNSIIIAAINSASSGLAHKIPMPLIGQVINVTITEVVYLTIFAGMAFGKMTDRIAERYIRYLEKI